MAGVSSKEIKNRIRSMESTKQITKAMEMVAASKLRRAQARIEGSRPYFEILRTTIEKIARDNRDFSSPYMGGRPIQKKLYIVIAGDRGLAGGYNSNILKMVYGRLSEKDVVLPIGKKAVDFFKSKQVNILTENYAEAAEVEIGDCFSISKHVSQGFLKGDYDEVVIAYTNFVSMLSQVPGTLELLPLKNLHSSETPEEDSQRHCDTIYEGSSEDVFAAIVPEYLGGVLYGALCESLASEQAARRSAMDSATQNAEDMIADLSLKFNRARQAAITQEITEIVAGS